MAKKRWIRIGLLLVLVVAAGYGLHAVNQAATERDVDRRTAVHAVKVELSRLKTLPRKDGQLTATPSGGLARLKNLPELPEDSVLSYAVDAAGKQYLVCATLERGGAFYATKTGDFSGPDESCRPSADPVAVGYATEAKMTSEGIDAYLRNQPVLVSKRFIQKECAAAVDEGQLQGCYTEGHIYLIDLPQQEIRPELSVTAAHEMLHAAWGSLSGSDRERIGKLLKRIASSDKEIADRADGYDAEGRIDELHAIVGTETADLTPELERHYARFLNDRAALVKRHLAYAETLSALEAEIDNLKRELDRLDARAEALLAAGDVGSYNALVGPYNSLVARVNDRVETYNELTAHTRPDDRETGVEAK